MTQVLRQSTAVDVLIGPFVDSTNGYDAETGVSPAVKLSKNGQALAAKNDVTTPVHDADGYYNCELDATDTNTVGTLVLSVVGSATSLPVRHEFQVIEEAAYDAIYASSASPATASALATAQADLDTLTGTDGVTLATSQPNYAPNTTTPPTAAAVADAVWDEDATAHQTGGTFGQAIGDPGANTETIYDAVVTDAAGTNVAADIIAAKADTAAILIDTAEIGAAGAGLTEAGGTGDHLTAVPWNAAWDAEVQSEVDDALVAQGLDHLVNAAVIGTDVTDNSIVAKLVSASATADWDDFVNTTDSLQANRDKLTDIETDTAEIGAAGAGLTEAGGTGDHLTAVPWNASWDAEVQSECADALTAYDPPTKAEMDALITTAQTEGYATDGSTASVVQLLYMIWSRLAESSTASTTLTAKKLDGSTTAMTFTLNDDTSPTSITRAS